MPNFCENDLYIHGDAARVNELLELMGVNKDAPEFDFNKVLPYPENFKKLDDEERELGYEAFHKKYGPRARNGYNAGGYEWCSATWGTKWNAHQVVRRDYGGVCVSFQTAWSPPKPVISALHKLFPDLTLSLEYFEMGVGYCGGALYVTSDDEADGWEAGVPDREWQGAYQGIRGG